MFKHNIFFICLLVTSSLLSKDKVLVTTGPSGSPAVLMTTPIITEAYKRLGIEIEILNISWARAILTANKGESDAELFRTEIVTELYKNIVIVKEPILFLDMVAFIKSKNIAIEKWEDLSPYRIAILRGVKLVEKNTVNCSVFQVNELEKAFEMLDKGRVDIVINEFFNGLRTVKEMGLIDIITLDPPLDRIPVYHFVHTKNKFLVPLLEQNLREMKSDGTTARIINEVSEIVLGN